MGNGRLVGTKANGFRYAQNEEVRRTPRKKRYQKGVPGLQGLSFDEAMERVAGMNPADVRHALSKSKANGRP